MAENQINPRKAGFFPRLFLILGAALLMALVYVSAILLQSPLDQMNESYVVQEEPEPVTRMQPAAMNDARALAGLFGAPLPYLPGYAMNGQGENARYEGANARVATLQYSGLTITAVRPAAAAPLLLIDGLSVSLRSDVTVLNLPALMAAKDTAVCVYFSGTDAAYRIYAPHTEEAPFFAILGELKWTD